MKSPKRLLEKIRPWFENHLYFDNKFDALLLSRRILTREKLNRVMAGRTRQERNCLLFEELTECNQKTFRRFKTILTETGQQYIVDALDFLEMTDWQAS